MNPRGRSSNCGNVVDNSICYVHKMSLFCNFLLISLFSRSDFIICQVEIHSYLPYLYFREGYEKQEISSMYKPYAICPQLFCHLTIAFYLVIARFRKAVTSFIQLDGGEFLKFQSILLMSEARHLHKKKHSTQRFGALENE